MAGEASTIDAQGAEAIKLYTSLLKSYPDYPRNDQVLYQLARAYETTGQPEKALATLDDVLRRYPQVAADGRGAVPPRRAAVLRQAIPPGAGRLWLRGEQGRQVAVPDAEPLQARLVAVQAGTERRQPAVVRRRARSHHAHRRRRASWCRSKSCRAPTASWPTTRCASWRSRSRTTTIRSPPSRSSLAGHNNPAYAPIIYSRLGDLYVEKERFQDAAAVYRAFATREPNSEFSPGLSMQAIEAYRKGGFTQLVLEGKREYVALYNYGTTFWQGRNKADYPNIAKELKINLKDVATYFHAERAEVEEGGRVPRGGALVPHLSRILPGRSGVLRHELPARPRRCTRPGTTRARPRSSRGPRTTTRAIRVRPPPPMRRWARSRSTKKDCRAAEKAEAHKTAVDAGVKFGTSFPEHPDSSRRADARGRGHLRDAGPAARHRGREPRARAPAAGRPAEAPHRVHHHRPVEFRPAAVRRGGEGLHRGARPAAAERQDARRSHRAHRLVGVSPGRGQAEGRRRARRGRRLPAHRAGGGHARRSPRRPNTMPARTLINLKEWPRAIQVLERFRTNNPKSEFTADVTQEARRRLWRNRAGRLRRRWNSSASR